jgi:hypothetical protein
VPFVRTRALHAPSIAQRWPPTALAGSGRLLFGTLRGNVARNRRAFTEVGYAEGSVLPSWHTFSPIAHTTRRTDYSKPRTAVKKRWGYGPAQGRKSSRGCLAPGVTAPVRHPQEDVGEFPVSLRAGALDHCAKGA